MFCKDITHLSPLHQTSSLESFHSLCSKVDCSIIALQVHMQQHCYSARHVHNTSISLYCRIQLAVLCFNENSNRAQATTKQGEARYDIIFPKYRKGGYVVRKVTEDATYGKPRIHNMPLFYKWCVYTLLSQVATIFEKAQITLQYCQYIQDM